MNILLTSVGRRTYMVNYFKDAIKGNGLVHAANSVETYSMKMADRSVATPLIYDSGYIDFLLEYCLKNQISMVLSLFDIDLPILSKNKSKFVQNGITLVVSDFEFINVCNDKWNTCNFLLKNNILTPATFLNLLDAKSALQESKIGFPLIVKPRWGMGSIGIFQADNMEELEILYEKSLNLIKSSYLTYESNQDIDNCVLIQKMLIGQEYGLDVFNDLAGNYLVSVPKKKLAMRAGETDIAEVIENKELSDLGKYIGQLTNHIGNIDVDIILSNNKLYVIELNCRFGGQYPFSHLSGVDFPKAIIRMVNKEEIGDKLLTPSYGVVGFKDIVPVKV